MTLHIHRREFIFALGGAATVWPLGGARAKQTSIPKVGVLWHAGSAEEEGPLFTTLVEGFRKLGYTRWANHHLGASLPQ
jgi:putative ABC transport system substrate-binding protein